jgi:hypothetical protein
MHCSSWIVMICLMRCQEKFSAFSWAAKRPRRCRYIPRVTRPGTLRWWPEEEFCVKSLLQTWMVTGGDIWRENSIHLSDRGFSFFELAFRNCSKIRPDIKTGKCEPNPKISVTLQDRRKATHLSYTRFIDGSVCKNFPGVYTRLLPAKYRDKAGRFYAYCK